MKSCFGDIPTALLTGLTVAKTNALLSGSITSLRTIVTPISPIDGSTLRGQGAKRRVEGERSEAKRGRLLGIRVGSSMGEELSDSVNYISAICRWSLVAPASLPPLTPHLVFKSTSPHPAFMLFPKPVAKSLPKSRHALASIMPDLIPVHMAAPWVNHVAQKYTYQVAAYFLVTYFKRARGVRPQDEGGLGTIEESRRARRCSAEAWRCS